MKSVSHSKDYSIYRIKIAYNLIDALHCKVQFTLTAAELN